jgi:hypothetical protein
MNNVQNKIAEQPLQPYSRNSNFTIKDAQTIKVATDFRNI